MAKTMKELLEERSAKIEVTIKPEHLVKDWPTYRVRFALAMFLVRIIGWLTQMPVEKKTTNYWSEYIAHLDKCKAEGTEPLPPPAPTSNASQEDIDQWHFMKDQMMIRYKHVMLIHNRSKRRG